MNTRVFFFTRTIATLNIFILFTLKTDTQWINLLLCNEKWYTQLHLLLETVFVVD